MFAAAPEEQGFFVRVTVTNKTAAAGEYELASLVRNAGTAQAAEGPRLVAQGQPLLRAFPAAGVTAAIPATAPMHDPTSDGRPVAAHSTADHAHMAAAAARDVLTCATTATAPLAKAEPALKP